MNAQFKLQAITGIAMVFGLFAHDFGHVNAKNPLQPTPASSIELVDPLEPPQAAKLTTRTRFRVINMIPNAQSNETDQDSEPNLAVDPANVKHMVGSAFTLNQTGALDTAPVYISTNGGNTWTLNNIVPSGDGSTDDISLKFATRGHTLYTGILRGGTPFLMNILRSADPFGAATMTQLVSRGDEDQPYVTALTPSVKIDRDHVFVTNNNIGANGKTATVDRSPDARTAAPPAGFANVVIEARTTKGGDRPTVRSAAHSSGVVYGLFARTTASSGLVDRICDITVVRDDSFGSGATPFAALIGADASPGVLVATGVNMPYILAPALGQNRLVSHMSIAVNPSNAAVVYISWIDRTGTSGTVLHVRRSTNSGVVWSADLLTVTNGLNPALAINSAGVVGILYYQLVGGRWQTHFRRTSDGTTWSDVILSDTPDNSPPAFSQPYLGDYCDLMAVGTSFYGVFSASNAPVLANFPRGVTYQRNANFATKQLRNLANTGSVPPSIDPFFFAAEQVPIVSDICFFQPTQCRRVELDPGLIKIRCSTEPCVVVDSLSRNCSVKFNCPGCEGSNVLCPPYHHIFIDEIDPSQWEIDLIYKNGEGVPYELNKTEKGLAISFRPDKEKFQPKRIGDYHLVFRADKLDRKRDFEFPTRLEVSDFHFAEHIKSRRP